MHREAFTLRRKNGFSAHIDQVKPGLLELPIGLSTEYELHQLNVDCPQTYRVQSGCLNLDQQLAGAGLVDGLGSKGVFAPLLCEPKCLLFGRHLVVKRCVVNRRWAQV
jgi:hypothetical protein